MAGSWLRPDQVGIDRYLWLPLSRINERAVRSSLRFENPRGGTEHPYLRLYDRIGAHLVVPRSYVPYRRLRRGSWEIVDRRPTEWPNAGMVDKVTLRDDGVQEPAYQALISTHKSRDKIVVASCGSGKTVFALKGAATRNVPTMIVGPPGLLEQWRERIEEFVGVSSIGRVHAAKDDWEHPICLASLDTLAKRATEGRLPYQEWNRHFGLWIFDEVHFLGAPTFLEAADIGIGERWGLSATDIRPDGMESIFYYMVGEVVYRGPVRPARLHVVRTGIQIPMEDITAYDGSIDNQELWKYLIENEERNQLVGWYIERLRAEGRVTLAFSQRLKHLNTLGDYFDARGIPYGRIDAKVKFRDRLKVLCQHPLTLAITSTAKHGLDRDDLDTCVLLLPEYSPITVMQTVGRAQRAKRTATLHVFQDDNPICRAKIKKLEAVCRRLDWEIVREDLRL